MKYLVDEELKLNLQKKLKKTFKKPIDNPVLKARVSWNVLSEQLHAMLGEEIHTQWFHKVRPIILQNNVLLLQADSKFASQWINTHYQQLVDALIIIQDRKYTCFFISPKPVRRRLFKSA